VQYLFNGVEKWKMARVVELLPAISHFSLFLFGVGLVAFLLEANMAVMITVAVVGSLGLAAYATLTVLPIFWPKCPYQTPLSVPCVLFFSFATSAWKFVRHQGKKSPDAPKLRERQAQILGDSGTQDIVDTRALKWLQTKLAEGRDVLEFISAIPNFLDTFHTIRHGDFVGQRIVLEASGQCIYKLLQQTPCANNMSFGSPDLSADVVGVPCMDAY
jgi:hypothetical protein